MVAFLVLLVLLVIGGAMLAAWLGFGLFLWGNKTRERAEARAPEILDAAFDGRPDVVFKVNLETPSFETVMLGAKERGYALRERVDVTSEAKTLIFEKL